MPPDTWIYMDLKEAPVKGKVFKPYDDKGELDDLRAIMYQVSVDYLNQDV